MKRMARITVSEELSQELLDLTDSSTLKDAIYKAIRFTVLHDKDSVVEALK